jgi:hypothetical protein
MSKKINSSKSLIDKINKNFELNYKESKKIINFNANFKTIISSKVYNVLNFYENNTSNDFLFSFKFNYYGIIDENNIFHWANTFHGVDRRFYDNVIKIKSKSHLFENSNDPDSLLYYQILTNDKFTLDDKMYEKLIKLLMYLDNSFFYIDPRLDDNTRALLTLKKYSDKSYFYEKKI